MYIHNSKEQTLLDIAQEYDVNPMILMGINQIELNQPLAEGQEILVLTPTRTVNVKRGETLEEIGHRFDQDTDRIIAANPILGGRSKIYEGQLLAIKYDAPLYGVAVRNGYMYAACPLSTLKERIYYLDILTLCQAVWRNGKLYSLFDDKMPLKFAKSKGKQCFLRVYLTESPSAEETEGLINSISIITTASGYDGVTIGGISRVKNKEGLIRGLKDRLQEENKLLYVEISGTDNPSLCDLCDGGILTYEKMNLDDIPSFRDGEEKYFEEISRITRSEKCFIELSSFAYGGGKFVEKDKVLEAARRKRSPFVHDKERLLSKVVIGGRGPVEYIYENLQNLKAKLELINILGFMGVAFDIMRARRSELMMIEATFSTPSILAKPKKLNCQGEM